MAELLLHAATRRLISTFIASPSHAIMITGPRGSGKAAITAYIAQKLLQLDETTYMQYPYIKVIRPAGAKSAVAQLATTRSISIDAIREVQQFTALATPSKLEISRIIIVEDAQMMTIEAQNALLKTLEEPPSNTIIIISADRPDAVLSTIQSRVRQLAVLLPDIADIESYFRSLGHEPIAISRALMLSGGLPGLMSALLSGDNDHSLVEAVNHARSILQSKTYQRLLMVDAISKQKQLAIDVLYVLGRMARTALMRDSNIQTEQRWQVILNAAYSAELQLLHNAQTKLVITNLMLNL